MRSLDCVSLILALASSGTSVKVNRDCVYDKFHLNGGVNGPCEYTAQIVSNVMMGDVSTPAFQIDGSHLTSQGPVQYMKQKKQMSATDFLACGSANCPELVVAVKR